MDVFKKHFYIHILTWYDADKKKLKKNLNCKFILEHHQFYS